MFNTVIVCTSKLQAKNLAEKLGRYLNSTTDHNITVKLRGLFTVSDNTTDETAYFITQHEVAVGRDVGIDGIRLYGDLYEPALDEAIKRKLEENKNDKT